MMDKVPEKDENYIDDIRKKIGMSQEAGKDLDRRILAKSAFTTEEAVDFAVEYAARRLEAWVLAGDMGPIEANEAVGLGLIQGPEDVGARDPRRLVEKVLFDAQQGDYKLLKNYLIDHQQRRTAESEISNKLEMIATVLPLSGKPVRLPIMSWKDPRFNPEASPPPDPR